MILATGMRALMLWLRGYAMNADDEQETTEGTSEMPEPPQEPARGKLRDLRPEKDPMGARNRIASDTGLPNVP